MKNMEFPKLRFVEVIGKFVLHIQYDDGVSGDVNLSEFKDKGVFKMWNKSGEFDKVKIDKDRSVLKWSDNIELDADSLYLEVQGLTFNRWIEKRTHAATH